MTDKQKLEAEIGLLHKEIENAFLQLNEIDSRRADAKNLSQFKELTASSNIMLQYLMRDFHKILGYVLLARPSGHNNLFFKSLLKRVRFMEELLHSFFKRGEFHHFTEWWFASKLLINLWNSCVFKIRLGGERSEHATSLLTGSPPSPILTERRKQISLVSSLLKGKSRINIWFKKKRLVHSLEEERDLMMVVAATYKKEEVDEIRQTLNAERWKKRAVYTIAGGVFLVPGGAAISLTMLQAYKWANKSSKNYKKLLVLVK